MPPAASLLKLLLAARPPGGCRAAACLLLWCLLTAGAAWSQTARTVFDRYTTADGLSNGTVMGIAQDPYGFIWLATEDGLNRFDGARFQTFYHDPADSATLAQNWVTALTRDAEGRLWTGSRHHGLSRMDVTTRQVARIPLRPPSDPLPPNHSGVTKLLTDREGRIWVGTYLSGLMRLDPEAPFPRPLPDRVPTGAKGLQEEALRTLAEQTTYALHQARDGALWVGTWDHGLFRYEPDTGHLTHFTREGPEGRQLSSNRIRAVVEDRQGYVWIGTSGGGLNRLDPRTGVVRWYRPDDRPGSISHKTIWSLFVDRRGTLWAGTYGGGLNRYDPATDHFRVYRHDPQNPRSLPSDVIVTFFEDQTGLLWIGTGQGAATYDAAREHVRHYGAGAPQGLPTSDVLAVQPVADAPHHVWVGLNHEGAGRLDLRTGRYTPLHPGLKGQAIAAIEEAPDGVLWLASKAQGLWRYDPRTHTLRNLRPRPGDATSLSHDALTSLLLDRRGHLWVGTDAGGGLNRLNPATGRFERFQTDLLDASTMPRGTVLALADDAHARLWVATTSGLARFDPQTSQFTRYRYVDGDTTSLSNNRITALHALDDGTLWVGTQQGLNRLTPGRETFERFGQRTGLASPTVVALTTDAQGHLWIATKRGLSRRDARTGRITNYGEVDGLQDTPFHNGALTRPADGQIVVGGPAGLYAFNPTTLRRTPHRPPLTITALKTFGEERAVNLPDSTVLRLSYEDSYFSFEFALLDYVRPADHVFQYRLEGFDPQWQQAAGPLATAHYANLDQHAGTFTFRLRGTDSKGRTSTRLATVVITPPWWRTRWFQASSLTGLLLLAGGSGFLTYHRRRRTRAEERRMLSEGREQERHFLARELHDVPLQNLYSVRHKLELALREAAEASDAPEAVAEALGMVTQTAEDLRRICGELRPPALGPFGLSKAIRSHLRTFQQQHPHLDVTFALDDDRRRLPETLRLALFRIYQSALANVARHAEAHHVAVRFHLTDADLTLEVEDDGRGFEVPRDWMALAREKHYGLLGISEWAAAVDGQLTVQAAPGQGALVRVTVPLQPLPWRRRLADALPRRPFRRPDPLTDEPDPHPAG